MVSRSQRIEALFHAALELDANERTRFLLSTCGGDRGLQDEVEALLDLDSTPDARLDAPAPEALALLAGPSALLVGKQLGAYRLTRCIATGGMGAVFEAEQDQPKRTVAVKVLRTDIATEDLERRFLIESGLLARLQHPGIAHVYEASVAELDGVRMPFIAMELVSGARSITDHARDQALSPDARIRLFEDVCDAVHHGHQRGVIHRDLKPANVLVDREGRPKLIDFGVARSVDLEGGTRRTELGAFLGTVQYMSPEQCSDARSLDVRSDVYALGVVLYQLLCGELPHDLDGVPLPQAARIVQEEPPRRPPSAAALGRDLETILLKALAKDPERRYQSVSRLAADLRRVRAHEPIEARAPSALYRMRLFARRHTVAASALVGVFLFAVLAAAVSTRFAWGERRAREREERSSYLANVAAADAFLRVYDAAGARHRLERVPPEHRAWEWGYLRRRLDRAERVLHGPLARCETLVWHGDRIASLWWDVEERLVMALIEASTGTILTTSEHLPDSSQKIALLSDGRVVFGSRRLYTWAPETGAVTPLPHGHDGAIKGIRVGSGDRIVSAGLDGTIRTWSADGRQALEVLGDRTVPFHSLAIAPDGRGVAVGGADGTIRLFAFGDEVERGVLVGHTRTVLDLEYSADGRLLASCSADATLRVWDVDTGREIHRLLGHESEVRDIQFLSDGLLASASYDGTARVWDIETEALESVLYGHENWVTSVVRSSNGRIVATGAYDGTLRFWRPFDEPGSRTIQAHEGIVRDMAFSPDGSLLASVSRDGTACLIETDAWQEVARLRVSNGRVWSLSFHPKGDVLATSSDDAEIDLWEVPSGRRIRRLAEARDSVSCVAFSARGSYLVAGSRDGRVRVYRDGSFELLRSFVIDGEFVWLAIDPAEKLIAVVSLHETSLSLWELDTGRRLWKRDTPRLHHAAFSPDGGTIVTGAGDFDGSGLGILRWRARDGAAVGQLIGHSEVVYDVTFSPSGERMASASADGTVRLWDTKTGQEVLALRGHES